MGRPYDLKYKDLKDNLFYNIKYKNVFYLGDFAIKDGLFINLTYSLTIPFTLEQLSDLEFRLSGVYYE